MLPRDVHYQVLFMQCLLQPAELLSRIEIWTQEEMPTRRLPKGSWQLLREAILLSEFVRSRGASLTGYQERQAGTFLSSMGLSGVRYIARPPPPWVSLGGPRAMAPRHLQACVHRGPRTQSEVYRSSPSLVASK